MKTIVLLLCALLALSTAINAQQPCTNNKNIVLDLRSGSWSQWLAVEVENANIATSAVKVKDAKAKSWSAMEFDPANNFWTFKFAKDIVFPVSFELTSSAGQTLTIPNILKTIFDDAVDTGMQFSSSSAPVTSAPTQPATTTTTTKAASTTTKAPSQGATTKPTTTTTKAATTTTKAPTTTTTRAPTTTTTRAPTTSTTRAPTTTKAPAQAPTTKPTTGTGCNAGIKMMIPLYSYPGSTWDTVIASAKAVQTVAIINPSSGPGNGPSSTWNTYMKKMNDAGVEMIGYVHTSYGARSISDVKKEIDIYASEFSYVSGIFLDEASAKSDQLAYYQELYSYIMSMPGFKYDVINPGAVPVQGYLNAATQIVSFENSASAFASSSNPSYASCSNKDKFVALAYGTSSASTMQSFLTAAKSKGYYGWAYVNAGSLSGGTWNSIPSYYAQQATYMASLNA